jgi:cytochrome c oxidase subunit II
VGARPLRRLSPAVTVLLVLGACSSRWGAPESASDQGGDILRLWQFFVPLALAIGALVWGLIIWSVVRYRRGSDVVPVQTREHVPLEVTYTVVPLAIVAVLFTTSVVTQRRVDRLSSRPDVVVEVEGFQWQWRFRYPGENVTVVGLPDKPPELALPDGRTAQVTLTSADVVHSFYVPGFLFKRDAIPGITNRFDVTPDRSGTYQGACAEFCGLRHDDMGFSVRVLPPAEFDTWLDARRTEAGR